MATVADIVAILEIDETQRVPAADTSSRWANVLTALEMKLDNSVKQSLCTAYRMPGVSQKRILAHLSDGRFQSGTALRNSLVLLGHLWSYVENEAVQGLASYCM
jgi:hypothetical protein